MKTKQRKAMYTTLSQMMAVQMFHHSLLFFSCIWCLHLSITDEIAMTPFKCIDSIMCLFHNFVTLIVKRFACLFDCIQQVGSNDVNLKSAANSKLVLQYFPVGNKITDVLAELVISKMLFRSECFVTQ